MNSMVNKVLRCMKQAGYLALQYAYTIMYWKLKFWKIQVQKWKKCGLQKKLDKVCAALGAEIYALHKQSETDWHRMPSVQQQLKLAEEAESKIFQVDEAMEEISNAYMLKKNDIKEIYSAKRAEVCECQSHIEE